MNKDLEIHKLETMNDRQKAKIRELEDLNESLRKIAQKIVDNKMSMFCAQIPENEPWVGYSAVLEAQKILKGDA